jgi:glycosyltransferase involved in cell wall biosynthesis
LEDGFNKGFMEKVPKVSVCIPVYNRAEIICDAIESVLSQTHRDFELIVTDNCSTDNTLEVVKKYAVADDRIKYYKNKSNLGVISNLNQGLMLAKGKYIKFLLSDDKLAPSCLEKFVDVMEKHPAVSLVTSYTQAFGRSSSIRGVSSFPGTGQLDRKIYQKDLLITGNWPGSPSSVMFRREDLRVGLFNHMWKYWLGDLDMSIRLLGVGDAYVVPDILSFLRIHDEQESSIHAVDFRLIRERLMLANLAFQFPHVYGEYTKAEQKRVHRHLLKRLVREGLGKKGFKPKLDMIKIGLSRLSYSRTKFVQLLIENLPRIFRKSRFSEGNRD